MSWYERLKIGTRLAATRSRALNGFSNFLEWCYGFPNAVPAPKEGRDANILKLIASLHRIKDIPAKELRTNAYLWGTRIANRLRLAILLPILVIAISAGVVLLQVHHHQFPRTVAAWAALGASALALLSLIFDTLPQFTLLISPQELVFRLRKLEFAHDMRMVETLQDFDLATLEAGEQWLNMKIERLKFWMTLTVGGSDKLSLFSLAGLFLTLRGQLLSNSALFSERWVTYLLAVLIGMVGGGLLNNLVIKTLLYQKDIATLAIRKSKETMDSTPTPEWPLRASTQAHP